MAGYTSTQAPTVDQAFITLFESEMRHDLQKVQPRLTNLCFRKDFQGASKVRFQLIGKSEPGGKARHGDVPISNPTHRYKELSTSPYYNGAYVDDLDVLKTNVDEKGAVQTSITAGFARERDRRILDTLDTCTLSLSAESGLLETTFQALGIYFDDLECPETDRYFAMGRSDWHQMLNIAEFATIDYVPEGMLPFGQQNSWTMGKMFYSFLCFPMTGLRLNGSSKRKNFAWHKNMLGYGVLKELDVQISFENVKRAWLITCELEDGSVLIPQADTNTIEAVVRITTTPVAHGIA